MLSQTLQPKLSGMLETLEQRVDSARDQSLAPLEFLALLLDDELERREHKRLQQRFKQSRIDASKTLHRFDFSSGSVSKTLLADLALCRFVEKGENVLFCGPTGTGKSHLAQALRKKPSSMAIRSFTVPPIPCWPVCTPACASYFFSRIFKKNAKSTGFYWKPDVLKRMDAISYEGDYFGDVGGGHRGEDVVIRRCKSTVQEWERISQNSSNETIFKNGLSLFEDLEKSS